MLGQEFFVETRIGRGIVVCAAGSTVMGLVACGEANPLTDNPTRWQVGKGTELYIDKQTTQPCGAVIQPGEYDSSTSYSQTGEVTDAVRLDKLPPNDGNGACPAKPWISLNDTHLIQVK